MRKVILYGSYVRGDFHADSDVDLMILLDLSDMELKVFSRQLSYMTYDFNMDYEVDIKPISKSEEHFRKWVANYPFYANIRRGVWFYMKQHDEEVGTKEHLALHRIRTAKDDAFRIFKDKMNATERSVQKYGYYSEEEVEEELAKI